MKRISLIVALLAVVGVFFSTIYGNWWTGREARPSEETVRKCYFHLKELDNLINYTLAKAESDEHVLLDIEKAVRQVVDQNGRDIFRSDVDGDDWVRVNPDTSKWRNNKEFASEIVMYSVLRYDPSNTNRLIVVGLNFQGDQVNLTNPPTWNPIPVWNLK